MGQTETDKWIAASGVVSGTTVYTTTRTGPLQSENFFKIELKDNAENE